MPDVDLEPPLSLFVGKGLRMYSPFFSLDVPSAFPSTINLHRSMLGRLKRASGPSVVQYGPDTDVRRLEEQLLLDVWHDDRESGNTKSST